MPYSFNPFINNLNTSTNYAETKAQKIRRLLAAADISNAVTNPYLLGANPWTASTAYIVGYQVSNNGLVYQCTVAGTSAGSGGPTGRAVGQTDNTVTWDYIGPQTAPVVTLTVGSIPAIFTGTNQIPYNNSYLRFLGCASPLNVGSKYIFPNISCGPGGKGIATNGVTVGAGSPVNGTSTTQFGVQICTDAPQVCFEFNNSNYPVNFIVEQDGVKSYVSPKTFPASGGGNCYFTLDFRNAQSTNGSSTFITGSGANLTPILSGGTTGTITGFTVNSGGTGYDPSNPPQMVVYGGGVTGPSNAAELYPTISAAGAITGATIHYSPSYTSVPTLVIQGNNKKRIITAETGESMFFIGCYVTNIDSIWAIPLENRLRGAFLGDSWTEGFTQSVPTKRMAMCHVFSHLLGIDDCINSGAGGTGYTTPMMPYNGTVTSGAFASGLQTVTLSTINATDGTRVFPVQVGQQLTFDTGSSQETVFVYAVNSGAQTITATFAQSHAAGVAVTGYTNVYQPAGLTTSGAISTGSQTITLNNITAATGGQTISIGNNLWVDPAGNSEMVTVTGVSGNNITATFVNTHPASVPVTCLITEFNINHNLRYADVSNVNADIIVIAPTGINDGTNGASAAIIQAECTKLYNNIKAQAPTTPIIWYGCNGAGNGTGSDAVVENGIAAAVGSLNDPYLLYVPVQLDPNIWLLYNQAYLNIATGHPSDSGYKYLGQRMLNSAVRTWIQNAQWQ